MTKSRNVTACMELMLEKLERFEIYIRKVMDCLNYEGAIILRKLHREMCLISIYTYLDSFWRCLIYNAVLQQPNAALQFYREKWEDALNNEKTGNCPNCSKTEELKKIKNYGAEELAIYTSRKELSFKRGPKKLNKIFAHLFGFKLFNDRKVEEIISDLNLVRNIIVHQSGHPDKI